MSSGGTIHTLATRYPHFRTDKHPRDSPVCPKDGIGSASHRWTASGSIAFPLLLFYLRGLLGGFVPQNSADPSCTAAFYVVLQSTPVVSFGHVHNIFLPSALSALQYSCGVHALLLFP